MSVNTKSVTSYGDIDLSDRPTDAERSKVADRLRWAESAGVLEGDDLTTQLEKAMECNSRRALNRLASPYKKYPKSYKATDDPRSMRGRALKQISEARSKGQITAEEELDLETKISEWDPGTIYTRMEKMGLNILTHSEKRLRTRTRFWNDSGDQMGVWGVWWLTLIPATVWLILLAVWDSHHHFGHGILYTPVWGSVGFGITIVAVLATTLATGFGTMAVAGEDTVPTYEELTVAIAKRRKQWKWLLVCMAPFFALVMLFYVPLVIQAIS